MSGKCEEKIEVKKIQRKKNRKAVEMTSLTPMEARIMDVVKQHPDGIDGKSLGESVCANGMVRAWETGGFISTGDEKHASLVYIDE